ncbi:MAG: DUF4350 domain-containing protein [Proteobacteria bacterium]|nr:DUF4350 domain-containing protein [Pseudomonadota bacterium]
MRAKLLLSILVIIFIGGLANLLILRFESGDVYPPYSSLRADPLGTKILFESLHSLKEVSVSRNYGPAAKLGGNSPETIFFIGVQDMALNSVTEKEVNVLESIASAGGRLIFLFYPQKPCKCDDEEEKTGLKKNTHEGEKKPSAPEKEEDALSGMVSLKERWGFETDRTRGNPKDEQKISNAGIVEKEGTLPEEIEVHSALYFKDLSENWNAIYKREGLPLIMERTFGKGSIVIAADAFFASNEALVAKRHAGLLSWLIGSNRSIIIDETHLGIEDNQGVVSLARKYGLEGLFAAIMLVTLLFIWRSTMSLIPPVNDEDFTGGIGADKQGRDHLSGFVGLLKRKVPSNRILALCLKEWEKSPAPHSGTSPEEMKEIGAIIKKVKSNDKSNVDQIALYNKISKLLWKRRYRA